MEVGDPKTQMPNERDGELRRLLQAGAQDHVGGRLAEAERTYRRILEIDANHADALHLLGALIGQRGDAEAGLTLIDRAISISPTAAWYYSSRAELLKARGKLSESIVAYRHALGLNPAMADVHTNLGVALRAAGDAVGANAEFREAIRLRPDLSEAWNNLGNGLVVAKDFDGAIAACQRAIALKGEYSAAYRNLGSALYGKGLFDEATAAILRSIAIEPAVAESHNGLANALQKQGKLVEAIAHYEEAIRLKPRFAEAYNNLSLALRELGRTGDALSAIGKALELRGDFPEAWNTLGNVVKDNGDMDGAAAAFERAIELRSDYVEAMSNLSVVRKDQARHAEAVELARRAIAIRPDAAGHGNLIYLLHFCPGVGEEEIRREQESWDRTYAESLRRVIGPHRNDRNANRRLRVGYIGPYFRNHVVGLNIVPLVREHGREGFEIFCYSDAAREDQTTEKCRSGADQWRRIAGLSDERVVELIRADGIDILVDLAQHLAGNRLLVMARKPAPVQVSFAGYPAGTGVKGIDYRLSDPYLDPIGEGNSVAEKCVRLQHSFWCYDGGEGAEVGSLPAGTNGWVTFGCLNNFCKVNEGVVDLWARVLAEVAGSRMVLLVPEGSSRQRVAEWFGSRGIGSERLEFTTHKIRREYLKLYDRIDIGLDTFPYNGHTTSLDSFWMGVPVVTIAGKSSVGRAGVSQLSNLKLMELIARDEDDFARIAAELAGNVDRLGELRAGLRERMRRSPIMDAPGWARGIEEAYRSMWADWVNTRR
jgi:predicted O-linked N-acetylglucosamine transferase (SPINDLY family)